jgi:hypothetical protein
MYFMGLNKADKKKLETEVISNDARLKLTRLIRDACDSEDLNVDLIRRNHFINTARAVLKRPIYPLEPDDNAMYMNEEFGWHYAETELVMRRPNTAELVEILGDMLQQKMLKLSDVNGLLEEGFDSDISVRILSDQEIEDEPEELEQPNIRLLTARMEAPFDQKDYGGVLHASASIFETLAKLVFNNPNVENQTLASFFEGYRKQSKLPTPLLNYILRTYKRRNVEPLAGHGGTRPPRVTAREAASLVEMTKMCVRLERRLGQAEIDAATVATSTGAAIGPARRRSTPRMGSAGKAQKTKPKRKKSKVAAA